MKERTMLRVIAALCEGQSFSVACATAGERKDLVKRWLEYDVHFSAIMHRQFFLSLPTEVRLSEYEDMDIEVTVPYVEEEGWAVCSWDGFKVPAKTADELGRRMKKVLGSPVKMVKI